MKNTISKIIFIYRFKLLSLLFFVLSLMTTQVLAHLMVAQHGTIKIIGNNAFIVFSLPVSAFEKIDDDGDNSLSSIEFEKYRSKIVDVVNQNIKLIENNVSHSLEGVLLSPAIPHGNKDNSARQLIVMGKFSINDSNHSIKLYVNLFGQKSAEQVLKVTVIQNNNLQKQKLLLTPDNPEKLI